ncbi:MAG: hypothetical protein QOI20_3020 [Acidimicrobiaceae bacterium]|nr:hypothetical protein [Acidimicrobiaceae bacterium]
MAEPERLNNEKLAAARLWAAHRLPYLASALFASSVVSAPDSGSISVDEGWRVHVDPALLEAWSVEQVGSVLVHHACHLLRDHAARARAAGVNEDSAMRWVRAADAEINDDLVDADVDLPDPAVLPGDLGCEPGRLAEEYFANTRDDESSGASCPCGRGADGQGDGGKRTGDAGLSEFGAAMVRRQVADDIIQHSKEAGLVPLGLQRWAEALLSPSVDWRRLLAAELRRGVTLARGMVDYTYRRPSRRAAALGDVVLPSLVQPVPEIAVVCDTSGSMDDAMLAGVLSEVDGILRAVGVRGNGVRVLSCDATVGAAQRVTSARQVQLVGGGGTDMGVGIAAAAANRPRPSVIVVVTDGLTPWPAAAPRGITVVVALLGAGGPPPPSWARCVRVDVAHREPLTR